MSNKIVAIGDIHGCLKSMKSLWDKLEPHKDALHIFIGDYIDRGPDSKGVVDFLIEKQEERKCIFLRGNHEQMLLKALEDNNLNNWIINGGQSTLDSYDAGMDINKIPNTHIDFFKKTLLYYETENFFFVHAGVPPSQTIEESKSDVDAIHFYLWGRDHLNAFETPWEKTIIFGHTPRPYPIRKNKMIGIDTGCVYDKIGYGKLTAVLLPETEFIQQVSID